MRTSKVAEDSIPHGLIVHGILVRRSRKEVETKNGKVEIVTYIIEGDDKKKFFVEDYAPEEYYTVDDLVSIPVYVKPYQKKTGGLSYTLNVQKDFSYSTAGEDF